MDKVIHFEIPADDVERGRQFYKSVFGWAVNPTPEMGYTLLVTVPSDENGQPLKDCAINGGMLERHDPVISPIITIQVDDIEAKGKEIEGAGGTLIKEKIKVGDMGFAAYFKDTEGNVLELWQNP